MDEGELLEQLSALAREAGIEVRSAREDELASGVCRVRGAVWVVLSASDPVAERVAVLARALCQHAAGFLERRYLPPAIRSVLEA